MYEGRVMPCYDYAVVIQNSYLILSLKNIKEVTHVADVGASTP